MNVKPLIVLLLCVFAATAVVTGEPSRGGDGDKGGRDKGDRHDRWDRERFREAMEKDWEEALAHFREHSPRRAEAFAMMSEEQQNFFKPLIVGRHRGIKWLSRDPELRENKERQIRIEDDIFAIKQKLAGVADRSEEAGKLKQELRKAVEALVDARMAERELRIERLEMLVMEERELLKEDKFKRQSLIEKRLEDILAAEVPVIDPPGPRPGDRRRGGDADDERRKD